MGIFSSLGRRAERLKRRVTTDTDYQCLACEKPVPADAETCPHCGKNAVAPGE